MSFAVIRRRGDLADSGSITGKILTAAGNVAPAPKATAVAKNHIGGSRAVPNVDVVRKILSALGQPESLMQTVRDRPGHDRRYALSSAKLTRETGWKPEMPFEDGLQATIDWYREHPGWIARVKSGEYPQFYDRNYRGRAV